MFSAIRPSSKFNLYTIVSTDSFFRPPVPASAESFAITPYDATSPAPLFSSGPDRDMVRTLGKSWNRNGRGGYFILRD